MFHTSPLNIDYQINNNKYIPNIGNIFFLTLFPVCVKKYDVLKYNKTKTPLNKQYMFFLCLNVSNLLKNKIGKCYKMFRIKVLIFEPDFKILLGKTEDL